MVHMNLLRYCCADDFGPRTATIQPEEKEMSLIQFQHSKVCLEIEIQKLTISPLRLVAFFKI